MDMEALHKEIARLRTEMAAYEAQGKLLENFVAVARSSAQGELLKGTLQKTLELSVDLTGAEKSSLFLFDEEGAVRDSILTRADTTPGQRSGLIGRVMDKGLAGWVTKRRELGLIVDTKDDDRWLTLPDQPYEVRSALAVPIKRGERLLGLITLLHSNPGHFTRESAALMLATSEQIALALENVDLYAKLDDSYYSLNEAKLEVEAYSDALDKELEKGRKIQLDFLPSCLPQAPGWEITAYFHPALQVSGDFYDVFRLSNRHLGLVVADVSDKGVGAALFMALFRSLIRAFAEQIFTYLDNGSDLPGPTGEAAGRFVEPCQLETLQAVAHTNNYIARNHDAEGMFVTLFFGVLNTNTGGLAFVNAGHEPLFVTGPAGIKGRLDRTGPAVGLIPEARYTSREVVLDPEDILIGYTDGVTEAKSTEQELFTRERLLEILEQPARSGAELLERIKAALYLHVREGAQSDDITMLAVHRQA